MRPTSAALTAQRSSISLAVRQALAAARRVTRLEKSALAFALTAGAIGAVHAQDAIEEIQVTGTRISRTTMETPTPVTSITAEELQNVAPGNLIDGLSQMPQFYQNQNPEQVNGGQNSGGSNVNLRGAGSNRTLTLLNGQRVVSSNRFGTPDVNAFPEDLLRSVETVTGGASASYGTDAVAGVVNFLLDTEFDGFKTRALTGATELGDGTTWEAGFAFGMDITERLHIIGSVSRFDQDNISDFDALADRDFIQQWARVTNPDPTGPTDIVRRYASPTNFTNSGVIVQTSSPTLNRLVFQPDGTAVPMPFSGIGNMNAGCLCQAEPTQSYGVNQDDEIQNAYERDNAFVYLDYDLGDSTNVFLQGMFSDNSASDRRESISLLSQWQGRIYADNVFLDPSVASQIAANGAAPDASGVRHVGYGYFPPNNPDTPLGDSRQETNNTTHSWTVGFSHDFTGDGAFADWSLDGYYQKGDNTQDFLAVNGVRTDRLHLAIDAIAHPVTGEPICRVNHPDFTGPIGSGGNGGVFSDCVPLNTFGGTVNISPAAADYIMDRDNKIARQWTDQQVVELVLSGDLWEGFGAGAIGAAFGASYRKEEFDQRTLDPSDEFPALVDGTLLSDLGLLPAGLRGLQPDGGGAGCTPGLAGIAGLRFVPSGYCADQNSSTVLFSSLRAFGGGFDVREAFGELNIPILSGARMAENFEVSTAARWADYSGSGEIWAWKVGANWSINDQLRVRATRSRDVRAATLRERFDQTRGGINVQNPWDNRNQVSAASLSGGNPNVNPEEADTYTAGVVFQPAAADNLSVSLDWYQIDISEALATLQNQTIVDGCHRGDLSLCQYVISGAGPVTDPSTTLPIPIDRVEAIFINLNNQRIRGVDFEMLYRMDLDAFGGSQLGWRFLASRLMENSQQTAGSNTVDDRAGQIGGAFPFPENRLTTSLSYTVGRFATFLQVRWIDGGLLDRTYLESNVPIPAAQRPPGSVLATCNSNTTICTIDDNTLPSTTYVDARFAATLGQEEQLEVFANINNVFDREPVIAPGALGRTGVGLGINSGLYDILGRRLTVGVNYSF
jgi:outer membrane receptor protein involved in Fe transport